MNTLIQIYEHLHCMSLYCFDSEFNVSGNSSRLLILVTTPVPILAEVAQRFTNDNLASASLSFRGLKFLYARKLEWIFFIQIIILESAIYGLEGKKNNHQGSTA